MLPPLDVTPFPAVSRAQWLLATGTLRPLHKLQLQRLIPVDFIFPFHTLPCLALPCLTLTSPGLYEYNLERATLLSFQVTRYFRGTHHHHHSSVLVPRISSQSSTRSIHLRTDLSSLQHNKQLVHFSPYRYYYCYCLAHNLGSSTSPWTLSSLPSPP